MTRHQAENLCSVIEKAVTEQLTKAWDEADHPRDERGRFTSGSATSGDTSLKYGNLNFTKLTYGGETWYEAEVPGIGRASVVQDETEKGFWNARVARPTGASMYLRTDNYNYMAFETPEEAMDEARWGLEHLTEVEETERKSSNY